MCVQPQISKESTQLKNEHDLIIITSEIRDMSLQIQIFVLGEDQYKIIPEAHMKRDGT